MIYSTAMSSGPEDHSKEHLTKPINGPREVDHNAEIVYRLYMRSKYFPSFMLAIETQRGTTISLPLPDSTES